jgi:hypothetical protein
MRTTTGTYDTSNTAKVLKPVVIIEIDAFKIIEDTFTGDPIALASHTPDIDIVGDGWSITGGTWTVTGGQLTPPGGTEEAFIETNETDPTITCDLIPANLTEPGIVFRYTDANNFWELSLNEGNNELRIYKNDGGVRTEEASVATAALVGGTTYPTTLTVDGNDVTGTVDDGTSVKTVTNTDSFNNTETLHGVKSATNASRYDDFVVKGQSRYTSGTYSDILNTDKKDIIDFTAEWSTVDIRKGGLQDTQMSFSLVDKNLDMTIDLSNNTMANKTIIAKYGYQDLALADFVELPAQKLTENPTLNGDLQTYNFVTKGVRRLLRGNIGRKIAGTTTDADIVFAETSSISVNATGDFIDPANLPSQWVLSSAAIKMNNEILFYSVIGGAGQLGSGAPGSISRGQQGTLLERGEHFNGTPVTQVYNFNGLYPTEMLLHILMTTDDGSGHAYYDLANADSAFQGMGLGLSSDDVDIDTIERLGYYLFQDAYWRCEYVAIHKEENGLAWIVENILKPAGVFLYINSDGKISINSFERINWIEGFSADDDLTADDININSYQLDYKNLINQIEMNFILNALTKKTTSLQPSVTYELDNSVTTYGRTEKPFKVFNGLMARLQPLAPGGITTDAEDLQNVIGRYWLYTFGNPLGILDFNVTPENWILETNDEITITSDKVPDIIDGTRGWSSKKFNIIGQKILPLRQPPRFNFKAITWEADDKVSGFWTDGASGEFITVAQGSIDDTDIVFSADNTITLEAADGYVDVADFSPHVAIFQLEITPPGVGTTNHWINIGVKLIDTDAPAIRLEENFRGIHYLSSETAAFIINLMISSSDGAAGFDRAKVDWYDASATAVSGERPSTITFKELKYTQRNQAMSTA